MLNQRPQLEWTLATALKPKDKAALHNPPPSTFRFVRMILDNSKGKFPQLEGRCLLLCLFQYPESTSISLCRARQKGSHFTKKYVTLMCFVSLYPVLSSADRAAHYVVKHWVKARRTNTKTRGAPAFQMGLLSSPSLFTRYFSHTGNVGGGTPSRP